jgi:branched-chain amino acid transport system permease protein
MAVLQAVVTGVLVGGIYAAMAVGLSIIFGVLKIINVAHAAIALLCAYVAYTAFTVLGVDPVASLVLTIPVALLIGGAMFRFLIRPVLGRPPLLSLLLLFGFVNVLEGAMLLGWTADPRSLTPAYSAWSFQVGPVILSTTRLLGFAASCVVVGGLAVFLRRSFVGRAIRATMQDHQAALLMGVNTVRVSMIAFLLGVGTAAVGGTVLGLVYVFYPALHFLWIGKLFCIVVLGGIGSVGGVLAGATVLGVAESLTATFFPAVWAELVAYVLLVLTLWIRPAGLFGRAA